ncbi:MAG: glycosyltransferase family 2 protein, partial [Caldilineaceae bacterium]|nr:glycosyltransferase family 2 protein [Caldilineaceae bacterium]
MVRLDAEADLNLKWVYGRAETQDFKQWRARRSSTAASTSAGRQKKAVIFLQGPEPAAALARSFQSLVGQTHQNWRLCAVSPTAEQASWLAAQADSRLSIGESALIEGSDEVGFIAFLAPGDTLVDHALACIQAYFDRHPAEAIAYTDEVRSDSSGVLKPIFKPDWSPVRQAFAPYVGRSAFVRGSVAARLGVASGPPERWIDGLLRRFDPSEVGHIRRPLVSVNRPVVVVARSLDSRVQPGGGSPTVGIVIPTRDRLDLLVPCLESLLQKTRYSAFETIVVDNGSSDPRTIAWLDHLKQRDARVSVVSKTGDFNFSDLCNFGAASLQSEFILFLNNDTEVQQADWLDNLLQFACLPDVGAVGAKLLYPNGRVQHAGVVLGMGGVAGHFGEGAGPDDAGWLGGSIVPHEVSAVTAACLMVARQKFEEVGGFDAVNLPVDLNDIDLCLRLAERGWQTICDCRTTLLHRQSASRGGGALRLQKVYARER